MKRLTLISSLVLVLSLGAYAADFSSYTTQELVDMKGTVAVEDRTDFQAEMQDRFLNMTPEERATYNVGQNLGGAPQGSGGAGGGGINDQLRDGSGTGGMNKGANRGGGR